MLKLPSMVGAGLNCMALFIFRDPNRIISSKVIVILQEKTSPLTPKNTASLEGVDLQQNISLNSPDL